MISAYVVLGLLVLVVGSVVYLFILAALVCALPFGALHHLIRNTGGNGGESQ